MVSYRAKLQRADRAVEEFRKQIDLRKPENYGFASMAAVPYAHIVANMLRRKSPKGAKVTLAPNPKDIVRPCRPQGCRFMVLWCMHADAERPVCRCGRTWGGARRRSAARRQSAGCG